MKLLVSHPDYKCFYGQGACGVSISPTCTELGQAVFHGYYDVVKILLAKGADVNRAGMCHVRNNL